MLEILKNLFTSNKIPSISFNTLHTKLVKWQESKVYPFEYNLPQAISFPETFWKDVIKIYKQTLKDGHERAISVFWADGDVILTSVIRGSESQVKSNNSVSVKYEQHPTKKEYARKRIIINNKTVKQKDIYYKKVPEQVSVQYLFNMHTHPKHDFGYSFFSKQDIVSLINSGAVMTALITDKLWVLMRTSDTPDSVSLEDADMSVETLKENMKLGVYVAEFNRNAIKQ
jgi:hypothetical protein